MTTIRLDRNGIAALAKSAGLASVVNTAAKAVADNITSQGLTASSPGAQSSASIVGEVDLYSTDRVSAAVTIKRPAGLALQAKYGVLTKACSAAGLELKS